MKLSTKISLAFLAVGLLCLILSFTAYRGFHIISEKMDLSLKSSTLIDAAMEMKYAVARDMQMIMELKDSDSSEALQEFWKEHNKFARDFDIFAEAIVKGAET